MLDWFSATARDRGAQSPERTFLFEIFRKTIEIAIETIDYCFKNNGLSFLTRKRTFLAESQLRCHYDGKIGTESTLLDF